MKMKDLKMLIRPFPTPALVFMSNHLGNSCQGNEFGSEDGLIGGAGQNERLYYGVNRWNHTEAVMCEAVDKVDDGCSGKPQDMFHVADVDQTEIDPNVNIKLRTRTFPDEPASSLGVDIRSHFGPFSIICLSNLCSTSNLDCLI